MGKITPPPIVRINSGKPYITLNQLIEAQRMMADAARGIAPGQKPRVCTQCGAPLDGDKCEYCNTEY